MNDIYSGFGTTALHAGQQTDANQAHVTPIYTTSTYLFNSARQAAGRFNGEDPGYVYGRFGSPTIREAEDKIAALETYGLYDASGKALQARAILHASGMGALTTLLMGTLVKGDKILSHYSLYGTAQDLMVKILEPLGIELIIEDLRDSGKAEEAIKKNNGIKLMYLETPANPTLQCVDLEALTSLAKQNGLLVAADNTFSTPYLQQPFRYGIDFIMHSTTKFMNGHGTGIGGVLLGTDLELMNTKMQRWHQMLGANSNGLDAFLIINGLKTLELRMERHCHNAMEVANFLDTHPAVANVNYPGLSTHPDQYTALKQMRHPGPMLSFELKAGYEGCIQFLDKIKLCYHAVSLGTTDTLVCHPVSTTHSYIPADLRAKFGISDGLMRMSVGIENVQDIIADLHQALEGF
jgi:methionine-gamma-lyase